MFNIRFILYLILPFLIPVYSIIIPLYILLYKINLNDSYLGLIIIYSALNAPFAVILMRSYMIQLPKEHFEAAKVDGASTFELFYKIAIPLSWPVFLTSGLIVGLAVWNEFLFAVTFIQDENFKPISTILFSFSDKYAHDYSLISAASIMMAAPIGILFILFQRNFIAGLTSGGLKG